MSMPAYIARRALTYAATTPPPASQPYALSQQFAAKKQLTYATMPGSNLARLEDAEDLDMFALPPADDGGAYRHVAYWLSVASRLLGGSMPLLTAAGKAAAWSTTYPIGSMSSSAASGLLDQARMLVQTESGRYPAQASEAFKVAAKLAAYSQPNAIAQAQKTDTGLMSYMRSLQEMSEAMGKLTALLGVGLGLGAIALIGWIVTKRRGS